jgi:hypothetical protein
MLRFTSFRPTQACTIPLFKQIRLRMPNIIFVDMIDWFVEKYGTTTPEDRDANRS